jgi:plasmid stability protein
MTPKAYIGVMADVKIRKLPDWVVEHHKRNAERAGRSLEEELRVLLTDQVSTKRRALLKRLAVTRESIRERHGVLSDSTADIREERERMG